MTDTSNDSKLDTILKLINGNKTEEKVAGVVLANKYLLAIEDDKVVVNIVYKIVKEVSPQFVLKMIQSVGQDLVHQSGLTLLVLSCKSKKTVLLFKKDVVTLIRLMFTTVANANARHQIITVLKSLLTMSSNSSMDIAVHTLLIEYPQYSLTMNPIDLLELFVDILHIIPVTGPSVTLSHNDAATLRTLFVQVFHGAAPESVRDRALSLCRDILSMKTTTTTSTAYTLSSQWTTLGTVRHPPAVVRESEEGTKKSNNNVDDSFPILLCSIVRGELHLLGEELLSLSSLNSIISEPVPATPAEGESVRSISDVTIVSRIARCTTMHIVCMSLLDCFLELLVGGTQGDLNTSEGGQSSEVENTDSAWADLPYQISLDVKKSLDGSLSELLEFAKECGKILCALPNDTGSVRLMSASQLRNIASRSVMTVTGFAAEDEGMHALLITYLGDVLACSIIPMVVEAEEERSRQDRVELVWNAVVSVDIDVSTGLSGQSKTKNADSLQVEELSESSPQLSSESPLVGDVLQYLLPCLLNVLGSLLEEDPEASPAERKEQRVQLDRFYNALDTLLPRVTELVCILLIKIAHTLTSENSGSIGSGNTNFSNGVNSQRTALNRGASVAVLALDLLLRIFSAKDGDLRILLRSEGEAAFSQIVALQAAQVRSLYTAMKNCLKPCNGFMKLLEREFEASVQRLATSDGGSGGVDSSDGVEGDALDLLCSMEQLLETLQAGTHLLDGYGKISSVVNC